MCKCCDKIYNNEIHLIVCRNVKELPLNLNNLQRLDMYNNKKIKHIPDYPNLIYLDCSYSSIQSINQNLTKLKYLNCRNTKLSHLPKSLKNIEDLNIKNTKIKFIPDTFTKIKNKKM
jgi:Leucine-rich repeat (LRR) protein